MVERQISDIRFLIFLWKERKRRRAFELLLLAVLMLLQMLLLQYVMPLVRVPSGSVTQMPCTVS